MSEKCRRDEGPTLSRGAENTIFGHIWSMLLFGDPVQCSPVTKTASFSVVLSCFQGESGVGRWGVILFSSFQGIWGPWSFGLL